MTIGGCRVHGYHWPQPLRLIVHHIQPLGMGGKDVPANRVVICDTGHYNVHRLLGELLQTSNPDAIQGRGTRKERALAIEGFDAWVLAGKPGSPVYELHPEETS